MVFSLVWLLRLIIHHSPHLFPLSLSLGFHPHGPPSVLEDAMLIHPQTSLHACV